MPVSSAASVTSLRHTRRRKPRPTRTSRTSSILCSSGSTKTRWSSSRARRSSRTPSGSSARATTRPASRPGRPSRPLTSSPRKRHGFASGGYPRWRSRDGLQRTPLPLDSRKVREKVSRIQQWGLSPHVKPGKQVGPPLAFDSRRRAVLPEDVGNLALEVLEDRERRAVGHRGSVQRVHRLEVLLARASADLQPPRLKVGRVRRRRQLAVAALGGEPAFTVVLLDRRCAEVARCDVDDAIRDLQTLQDLLLDAEQTLV